MSHADCHSGTAAGNSSLRIAAKIESLHWLSAQSIITEQSCFIWIVISLQRRPGTDLSKWCNYLIHDLMHCV